MMMRKHSRGEPERMVLLDQSRIPQLRSLYESHAPAVYSLSLRLPGDMAAAEQATATVFVTVARHLDQLPESMSFENWLKRLTADVVLRYFLKRDPSLRARDDAEPGDEVAEPWIPLDAQSLEEPALEAAIRTLPLDWRCVFVLHDIEGFSHEEIAALLGWTIGAVKATVKAARVKVRETLLQWRRLAPSSISYNSGCRGGGESCTIGEG